MTTLDGDAVGVVELRSGLGDAGDSGRRNGEARLGVLKGRDGLYGDAIAYNESVSVSIL
jgi:hypothetical protein